MKILLAHSYFLEQDANEQKIMKPYPPLGMLYVASSLKAAGHTVEIFDSTFRSPPDFRTSLDAFAPDLVGISANVITRENSLTMVREVHGAGLPVVVGGPDPSGDPEAYIEAGAAVAVRGEGDQSMVEVAACFGNGSDAPPGLDAIAGLSIPHNGSLRETGPRERIQDLNALPMPDRDGLDMTPYLEGWKKKHGYTSMSLITSRGCPYQCSWCSKEIFGEVVRQRSPESVIEEIRHLHEKYGPDQLWFADDILTLNRNWILELTQRMVDEKLEIPFECLARVDRVDKEVLDHLKRAGCFRVWFGAESGSARVLKSMNKHFTLPQVTEAVDRTRDAGIQAGLFILIGYPGEKVIDLLKTLKMIRRLAPHYCGSSVAFPIKGTPFYKEVQHLLAPDYTWSRRNENRMSFSGRYPTFFYACAVRCIHNWSTFFGARTRNDGAAKQLVRFAKFMIAGTGMLSVGLLYDLKTLFYPDRSKK